MGADPGGPSGLGQPGPLQPGEFTTASVPNVVSFGVKNIGPPTSVYIQRDDVVSLRVWNNLAGQVIGYGYRFWDAVAGRLIVGSDSIRPAATRAEADTDIALGEGYLLALAVGAGPTAPTRGQTFISGRIVRSVAAGRFAAEVLFADYLDGFNTFGWPGARVVSSLEGPGFIRTFNQANPAAGADWIATVPTFTRWRLQSLSAVLTTSAVAGARIPQFTIDDGANTIWTAAAQQSFSTVSTGANVSGSGTTSTSTTISTNLTVALPPAIILGPGYRVRAATQGLLAGDQWSAIWLGVEEWITTLG